MRRATAKEFLNRDFDYDYKEVIVDHLNAWKILPEVQEKSDIVEQMKRVLDNNNDLGGDIPYWNELIIKNPQDSEAIVERAISKKEIGDIAGAYEDLKKAAELGDQGAAQFLEEYSE